MEGLTTCMQRAGLSRTELAEALDVDVATIWRWEKGKRQPKQQYIAKMTIILRCSADELLGINPIKSRQDATGLRSTRSKTDAS